MVALGGDFCYTGKQGGGSMKVLIGHFGHEANTFAENKTTYADFIGRGIRLGE